MTPMQKVLLRNAERAASPPFIIPAGPDYGRNAVLIKAGTINVLFFPRWPEVDDLVGLELELPPEART